MAFIKDELIHLILTLGVAGVFYWRYRNWRLIIAALIFGFLTDIDHLFDYFAYFGLNFSLMRFINVNNYMLPSAKIYVPFHAWEYIPILGLIGLTFEKRLKIEGLMMTIVVAYFIHLLKDNFSFPHHPLAYSLIYRWLNNFSLKSFNVL